MASFLIEHADDFEFVRQCLERNESSLNRLHEVYRPRLLAFLKSQGAFPDEALDIVERLLTECVHATATAGPKFQRYKGGCALKSWLNTNAMKELISLRRLELNQVRNPTEEEIDSTRLPEPMRSEVEAAFRECSAEDYVLLQLFHCEVLSERELALMFRCDVETIHRRIQDAGERVKRLLMRNIKESDSLLELNRDGV